jgi:hypothetical protein
MEALYEFFGGQPNTYHTYPSSTFPSVKGVFKGEPIEKMEQQMPMLYVTSPKSTEQRKMAQVKFITYQLDAVLLWKTPGVQTGGADRGPSVMDEFYSLIDDIADKIRTNKTLITSSYPNGASFKFGENFSVTEAHEIAGQMIFMVAHFQIESVEQVMA